VLATFVCLAPPRSNGRLPSALAVVAARARRVAADCRAPLQVVSSQPTRPAAWEAEQVLKAACRF